MPKAFDLPGASGVQVQLRTSARARRLSLSVSRLDGAVTMTVPAGMSATQALRFAGEKRDWILRALERAPRETRVVEGTLLPVLGQALRLTPAPVRAPRVEGDALLYPQGKPAGACAQALLRTLARERLAARVAHHAGALGVTTGTLTLRDTRSRWGSCTAAGDLMFSWRIALAPPEVLDYLAAHEVAHRREMNHSPAFWSLVGRLLPGYAAPRAWLKQNGAGLHRFRFTAS